MSDNQTPHPLRGFDSNSLRSANPPFGWRIFVLVLTV